MDIDRDGTLHEIMMTFHHYCSSINILVRKNIMSDPTLDNEFDDIIKTMLVTVYIDTDEKTIQFVRYTMKGQDTKPTSNTSRYDKMYCYNMRLRGVGSAESVPNTGYLHRQIIVDAIIQNMIMNCTANLELYQFDQNSEKKRYGRITGGPDRTTTPVVEMAEFLGHVFPSGRYNVDPTIPGNRGEP